MASVVYNLLIISTILILFCMTLSEATNSEHYCQSETFQPQCLKNEVILMRSATYGRMRIGRCLTEEEVKVHEAIVGQDPRYFGCSADVLRIFDRKCSGRTECQVRVIDMPLEIKAPCLPGLFSYLEASYVCVNVADEERSCSVSASAVPVHIVGSSDGQKNCGTKSQPWNIEAPLGQKIKVHLIEFNVSQHDRAQTQNRRQCVSYGTIVDKLVKRNSPICGRGTERETEVYVSSGNAVEIVFELMRGSETTVGGSKLFLLRLEAVGCSDLIPPEDAWLKRSEDTIVIGCYSSRQSWHLRCEGEHWVGVFGNCSSSLGSDRIVETETKLETWNDGQVLTMVAVGGLTLTVCLAVLCTGIICFRRFSPKVKKTDDYRTLNYQYASCPRQCANQPIHFDAASSAAVGSIVQPMPTYSVYVGEEAA